MRGRRIIRLRECALALAASLAAGAAALAQTPVTLAAEPHGDYARIVATWPRGGPDDAARLAAEVQNGVLIVRFAEPVTLDPAPLIEALPNNVALARLDPSGQVLRVALRRPARAYVSQSYDLTAIDLLDPDDEADPADIVSPRALEAERAAEEAAAAAAEAARRAAMAPPRLPLRVRYAQAADYARVIFDWTESVEFALRETRKGVEVTFARDAAPDLARLRIDPPNGVLAVHDDHEGDQLTVAFDLSSEMTARAWSDEERVVVDILHVDANVDSVAALEALALNLDNAADIPTDIAPEPLPDLVDDAEEEEARHAETPSEPEAEHADAGETAVAEGDAEADAGAEIGEGESVDAVEPETDPEPDPLRYTRALDEEGYGHVPTVDDLPERLRAGYVPPDTRGLDDPTPQDGVVRAVVSASGGDALASFEWAAAVGAAAFRRGDAIWLVFDAEADIDIAEIRAAATRHFLAAEAYRGDGYAAVRIETPSATQVSVVRDGATWTFAFGEAATPPSPASIERRADETTPPHLFASLPNVTAIHAVEDPEAMDTLIVATAFGPAQGLPARRTFVEVTALASAHGLAFERAADGLDVAIVEGGVRLEHALGAELGASAALAPALEAAEQDVAPAAFIDFENWSAPVGRFAERHDALARAAAYGTDPEAGRLDLARFLVAEELGAEALGVLRLAQSENPRLLDAPEFRALRGVANLMVGRLDEAETDLASPPLADDPSAALWRGFLAVQFEDWREARRQFEDGEYELRRMRSDWGGRFQVAAAETALELNDLAGAKEDVDEALAQDAPEDVQWRARLIEARFRAASGDKARAIAILDEVASSGYEPIEVEALFERITILRELDEITLAEAAEELDALRYRWRGDAVELEIIRQLGAMYVRSGELRRGMSLMQSAARRFPENPVARRLYADMNDIFRRLFLDGEADALDPIEALALWYEFNDLTPIGADGDRMLRRLADRLVAFDLLEQAAELLDHQVRNRLRGLARAQVATDLAAVYLMDRRAEDALNALRTTRVAGTPAPLAAERRLLEARALAELGRRDHALELLEVDRSPESQALKASIAWEARLWAHSAELLEGLAGESWRADADFSAEDQSRVLRAAVAYSLADDPESVRRLVGRFGPKMSASRHAATWRTVTGEADVDGVVLRDLAGRIAETDTLDAFLEEFRARRGAHASGDVYGTAGEDAGEGAGGQP